MRTTRHLGGGDPPKEEQMSIIAWIVHRAIAAWLEGFHPGDRASPAAGFPHHPDG
jgi:hypothetical protein